MRRLVLLFLTISILTSCDDGEPRPVLCLLRTSTGDATCRETKPGGKIYDAKIKDFKDEEAWITTSGKDFSEMRKYYKEIKQQNKILRSRLDACEDSY